MYSKTQYGKVIIWLSLIFILGVIVFYDNLKNSDPIGEIASLSTVFFLILVVLLFYKLKVELKAQEIILSFGVGIIKKRIDINQIQSVESVKNKFWFGWGIRLTPHGWLWNVAGYDAVELTFKNDKRKFRIGCEDSNELKSAIEKNMN
jgi:hypothetical protein